MRLGGGKKRPAWRMEARRQQLASAAVAAAAAAGDINLPSGLLADFEFSVSLVSAELKDLMRKKRLASRLAIEV